MRKLNLLNTNTITFEEGCDLYLLNCCNSKRVFEIQTIQKPR